MDPSAPITHQPALVALPVAVGLGGALVVGLLALGQGDFQLHQAAVVEIEPGRDDRAALALDGADQLVDLLAVQQQFALPPRLVYPISARCCWTTTSVWG